MLDSARNLYEQQQSLTAHGLTQARRVATRGPDAVAQVVARYQVAAAIVGADAVPEMLTEQGIDATAVADVNPASVATYRNSLTSMFEEIASNQAFDRLASTLIQDAGRTATGLGAAVRPAATGHVRYLNPPSCSRCAILAGRVYRYSQGFLRHPRCDCQMVPTDMAVGPGLVGDPMAAFAAGQIRGLSQADTRAIRDGADLAQVVNIRRRGAGLSSGASTLSRRGVMTPEGIYRLAKTRDEAIALLDKHGYVVARQPLEQVAAAPTMLRTAESAVGNIQESLTGANPHHNKTAKVTGNFVTDKATGAEMGYNYNCTNAVTAYEMRMRGQAVSARPISNVAIEGNTDDFLARWRKPDGEPLSWDDMSQTKGLRGTQDLVKSWDDGGRGFVMVQWKRDGGHVFVAQNDGGKVRFLDPQSGVEYEESKFQQVATRRVWAVRSDNLEPAGDFGGYVE